MSKCKSIGHDGKISAMTQKDGAGKKLELRAKQKLARATRSYDPELAALFNVHLAELCLSTGATRVACYLPYGDEPDTELFLDWALENEIEVLLPISKSDGNLDWVVFDGSTKPGLFGFHEADGPAIKPTNVDLAFVPALAVSESGIRLGKGKGFYDRALPKFEPTPPVVAIVYSDELLAEVPREEHDHPVDAVITERGITYFNERLK
jgi:5-formyltetrahydrofolate cyclo-ligase